MQWRTRRRLLVGLGVGLVLLLLVVLLGVPAWLQSSAGSAFLRGKVLEATRDSVAGSIEMASLSLVGRHVVVEGLRILTPEGELVVEVERVEADVELGALLAQRIVLTDVKVTSPHLFLVQDERGLNLSRAVAPKGLTSSLPAPASSSSNVRVIVRAVELTGGRVEYRDGARHLQLDGLRATGSADVATSPLSIDGELSVEGAVKAPLEAPLRVHATAHTSAGNRLVVAVEASAGASRLAGHLSSPALELELAEFVAAPELVRSLEPSWPLRVPLRVSGKVSPRGGAIQVGAGAAVAKVGGAWDATAGKVEHLDVAVSELDLSEVLEGGQPTRLAGTATLKLADSRLETATGSLTLKGTWDTPARHRLADVQLDLLAVRGKLEVKQLLVAAPGATLSARGQAARDAVTLSGKLEAQDLAALSAAVSELTGASVSLGGKGELLFTTTGSLQHPGLHLSGALSSVRVASAAMASLDVVLDVPDLTKPLHANGVLTAKGLMVGDRALEEVTARVSSEGRDVEVSLSMKGLGDLSVVAGGTLDPDSNGVELARVTLHNGADEWLLEAPAHLSWGRDVVVSTVALRSKAQRLVVVGALRGTKADASLDGEHVDLARLPRVLTPEALGLSGDVSWHLAVTGKLPRPDATLKLEWHHGALASVEHIELQASAAYRQRHVTGDLTARTSDGDLTGTFDVPLDALLAHHDEPWRLKLEATNLLVERLAALAKLDAPAAGRVGVSAEVTGTARAPLVQLVVTAPTLTVHAPMPAGKRDVKVEQLELTVTSNERAELGASVSARVFGGSVHVALKSPLTLAGLIDAPPTVVALKKLVVATTVDLSGLDIAQLHGLGLTDDDELAGRFGLKGTATGSVSVPRFDLEASLSSATVHPMKNVDLTAHLLATDAATTLNATAAVKGKPAVTLEVSLGAAPESLIDVDALGGRAMKVTGRLLPIELNDLLPGSGEAGAGTHGQASASLDIDGTLDAPQLKAVGSVQHLAFAKVPLGAARFEVSGSGKSQAVTLVLGGLGRDDLRVHGTVGLDLSLASLRGGFEPGLAPLALDVESRDLDLAFLSGVTDSVRKVAGRLTMKAQLAGRLDAPHFVGTAQWTQGRLSLSGLGDYRDLELDVVASNDSLELKRLTVKAGAGAATVKAKADRTAGDVFHLAVTGDVERFPIVYDDQLLATLSTKFVVAGELSDTLVDLTNVEVSRVDVELPEVKRKNLQNLERPKDVIVLRNGSRVSERQRRAARASTTGQPGGPRAWRALLNAPRNLWVRSSDLNVELGLSENFRFELGATAQLFGEAQVLRGRINVIGREFEVQKSSQLRFAGPAKDPYVNVTAVHTNSREKVVVTVTVVGKGTDVTLKTSSDPPMPESDIYTLLATGRRQLRAGAGASITAEDAVSAVGNVAASQLKTLLAKKLPIDVLNFEASENFQSIRLDVGKYVGDSLYFGYSFQPGANEARGENQHTGRVEVQMSRRWSVDFYAGTAPAAGADILWSRDF